MLRLGTAFALLALTACVQGPFAPLPVEEARAARRGPPPGTAVVMLVPPGAGAALPLIPGVALSLDGRDLAMLGASEALLLPVATPARLGAANPATIGGTVETALQPGRTVFLAIAGEYAPGPRSLSPHPRPVFRELPEAEGRALLAGRVPVGIGGAAAEPGQEALRGVPADAAAAAAVARAELAPGRARLIVGAGEAVNARTGLAGAMPGIASARGDLVLDGVDLAYVEGTEVVVLDLPPGRYVLNWRPRIGIGSQRMPPSMVAILARTVELEAGRQVVLSADLVDGRGIRVSVFGTAPGMTTGETTGQFIAVLSPLPEDAAALLARPGNRLLVPPAARLAAMPGAMAPGR